MKRKTGKWLGFVLTLALLFTFLPAVPTVSGAPLAVEDWGVAALSDEKEIIDFWIPNQLGSTIRVVEKTVEVTMPFGTDVTLLTPVITVSAEATISPESRVTKDFSNPVTYTVTAEDGSVNDYRVSVTVLPEAVFTAQPETVFLNSPVDLVFKAGNAASVAPYLFTGIAFMNVTTGSGYGKVLTVSNGVVYDEIAGTVTVPAALFGLHTGRPLTTGVYRAKLLFGDGPTVLLQPESDFRISNGLTVSVTASPSGCGTVSGGGMFAEGSTCMVVATPNSGYRFMGWTENGIWVSEDSNYTFSLTTDRDLMANFEPASSVLPQTGDGGNLILCVLLVFSSILIGASMLVGRKFAYSLHQEKREI